MRIYKLLLVFLASLALAGCSSKQWDWFFDDDEEEVVYEEEEVIVDDEEILDEEEYYDEEEYAEEDEEYEYEYEYEDEEDSDARRQPQRGDGRGGVSRYGDEPEYREPQPQDKPRQATSRTPGRTAIYFDYKKDTVPANGLNLLQLHAQFLKANPDAVVTVEGHTDSVAPAEYNKRLGLRRAEEVAELLVDMGVSTAQIVTISYGEERPAKSGDAKNAQALNRRVELVY